MRFYVYRVDFTRPDDPPPVGGLCGIGVKAKNGKHAIVVAKRSKVGCDLVRDGWTSIKAERANDRHRRIGRELRKAIEAGNG